MSCDLNPRGVKRKLEPLDSSVDNEIEPGVESSLCNSAEPEPRKVRFDDQLPTLSSTEEVTSTCPNSTVPSSSSSPPPTVSNTDQFFRPLFVPSPGSSDSMSDDDDEDDDSEDDDYTKEDEDEDDVFLNHPHDDTYGLTNADSESSYEDRALSSSLSDSSTSSLESEFSPIMPLHMNSVPTSLNGALYSSSIHATSFPANSADGPYSSHPDSHPTQATPNRNTSDNGYYCAYNAVSSSTTNLSKSAHYPDSPQQSYLQTNNVSSTLTPSSGENQSNSVLRQRVFHLSVFKWSRFRQSADPCLHKSVMICNTLRMLEKELEREGVKINFNPNGVSFISPVQETPEIEVLPILPNSMSSVPGTTSLSATVSSLAPSIPPGCSLGLFPNRSSPSNVPSDSGLYPYQSSASCDLENCSGYEKYFSMERSSQSGRVTPFVRPTTEEYSNRVLTPQSQKVSESSSQNSSGYWGSNSEETMSDRLSSFNWSNMLNFNSSSPSASEDASSEAVNGDAKTSASVPHQISSGTQENTSEASLATGGMMPYSSMSEQSRSTMLQSSQSSEYSSTAVCTESHRLPPSQCNSASAPTTAATFATLLPPASTLTMSASPMEPISSASSVSDALPYTTSFYSTSSSGQSMYSSSISNGGGSTTSVSGLMCSTGSYLGYTGSTETEMFGDIDLSQYDFDLISEDLSPSSASNSHNKTIISAEELILSITSCSTSDLCAVNTYTTVNSFSGQSYTSSTSSTSNYTNGPMSSVGGNASPGALHHHQLTMANGMVNSSLAGSTQLNNCGTTSTISSGHHLHTASGRYYKTSEERDQQAITTIKCHN